MAEVRIKDIDEHEIDTVLAEDIDFEGQLTFKKPLMIKGKFKGEISSSSALYVGEKANVEAKVEANLVSSKGRIKGDMVGHSRVELFSTAHVDGDITTPDFVVESGCKFNGYCNMGGQKKDGAQHGQQGGHHGASQQAPQPAPAAPQGQQAGAQGAPQGQQPPQAHQAGPQQQGPQQHQGGQQQGSQQQGQKQSGPQQGGQQR